MRSALSFLTIAGGSEPPRPSTLDWFPAVGLLIGAALGVLWWAAGRAWPVGPAAAVVVAADLAVTGLLHFDGLVDSADGLIAPLDRERRLAVMAAPDAGSFGVGAAAALLLVRWSALSATDHRSLWRDVVLLAALWCVSRTLAATVARWRPYARETGLAAAFAGPRRPAVTVLGLAAAIALAVAWKPVAGAVALATAVAAGVAVVVLADRRIGGYTGDVLGATVIVTETVGLLTAAARW